MPRILVTTDDIPAVLRDAPVLLSESVSSVHIDSDHAAEQLIQRLAWAIRDAEEAQYAAEGAQAA